MGKVSTFIVQNIPRERHFKCNTFIAMRSFIPLLACASGVSAQWVTRASDVGTISTGVAFVNGSGEKSVPPLPPVIATRP